jgi:hypothetical protein
MTGNVLKHPDATNGNLTNEGLRSLLEQVQQGVTSPDEAMSSLRNLPFEDLGYAKIDHHRTIRIGLPEVIYAEGKSADQVAEIFSLMAERGTNVLATRASDEKFSAVKELVPGATYNSIARTICLHRDTKIYGAGTIAVLCAGTSDLPVAEEARVTAELMGNIVEAIYDVGVAGLHRLLAHRDRLQNATALIVCAGMEGALPSVVGGLSPAPVIAVPTSVGYGASFHGLAALLGMLNSCSPNVAVVNIDNGFGAAYFASSLNRRLAKAIDHC